VCVCVCVCARVTVSSLGYSFLSSIFLLVVFLSFIRVWVNIHVSLISIALYKESLKTLVHWCVCARVTSSSSGYSLLSSISLLVVFLSFILVWVNIHGYLISIALYKESLRHSFIGVYALPSLVHSFLSSISLLVVFLSCILVKFCSLCVIYIPQFSILCSAYSSHRRNLSRHSFIGVCVCVCVAVSSLGYSFSILYLSLSRCVYVSASL
jgi:hypothetical protein